MDRRNIMNHNDIVLRNKTRRTTSQLRSCFPLQQNGVLLMKKKYYP